MIHFPQPPTGLPAQERSRPLDAGSQSTHTHMPPRKLPDFIAGAAPAKKPACVPADAQHTLCARRR
jgi:hypothetical protein